jgi:hypothetical protein
MWRRRVRRNPPAEIGPRALDLRKLPFLSAVLQAARRQNGLAFSLARPEGLC